MLGDHFLSLQQCKREIHTPYGFPCMCTPPCLARGRHLPQKTYNCYKGLFLSLVNFLVLVLWPWIVNSLHLLPKAKFTNCWCKKAKIEGSYSWFLLTCYTGSMLGCHLTRSHSLVFIALSSELMIV